VIPDAYFDRFATPKYRAKNPLQRALIRRFAERLHALFIEAGPAESVLEIGVGEGFLSGYLSEKFPEKRFTGVEPNAADLALLRPKFPRIEAHQGSIYDLGFLKGRFDVVLCCEVLEHLTNPGRGLSEIHRLTPSRAIFSVPHEPFFMLSNLLRGKNVPRLGNDVDHVQHFGLKSFRALLEPSFEVLELTTSYPWILALTRPR
jgi:SAM-dependent methyltransferase